MKINRHFPTAYSQFIVHTFQLSSPAIEHRHQSPNTVALLQNQNPELPSYTSRLHDTDTFNLGHRGRKLAA